MTEKPPSTSHLVREYRSLLDALPVGILIHHDLIIRYANRKVADVVGVEEPGVLLGEEEMQVGDIVGGHRERRP